MSQIAVAVSINASPQLVFDAVSNIENLPNTVPSIEKTVFLSDVRVGVGTRFVETRVMKGKRVETELEITEFEAGRHVRMVNESHGTVWDTTFSVSPEGPGARLELVMDARSQKLLPRIMNRIFRKMIAASVQDHVGHVKSYCEQLAEAPSNTR